jgi:hypothetical protein
MTSYAPSYATIGVKVSEEGTNPSNNGKIILGVAVAGAIGVGALILASGKDKGNKK